MTLVVEAPLREQRSGSNHEFKNFVMDLAREMETGRDEEIEFATDSDRDDDDNSLYTYGSDSSESEVTEARSPPKAPLVLSIETKPTTSTKPTTKPLKGPTGFLIPAFPEVPTLGLPLDDDMDLDSVSLATAKQSLEELEQPEAEDDESYASLPRSPQQLQQKPLSKKASAPVATVTIDPYATYDWMEAYHPDQVQEEQKKGLVESVCCSFLSWLPFGFQPKANALVLPPNESMEDEETDDLSEAPKIVKVSSKTRIVFPSYSTYAGAAPTDLAYQMEQTGLF